MFRDRHEAGRRLAGVLAPLRAEAPVVIALPRGGVPVAGEIATTLDAPLDVLIVRKIGAPSNPEFAMGALGEDGALIIDERTREQVHVTPAELDALVAREQVEIGRRISAYRDGRPMTSVLGRTVILVDDGLATGATASAGVAVLRHLHAGRIIVAVPTGSAQAVQLLSEQADDVVCLEQPEWFGSVGSQYDVFDQTSDTEVVTLLNAHRDRSARAVHSRELEIPMAHAVTLPGNLCVPHDATGIVIFAHGSGSSRLSPRNRAVAESLQRAGFATVLFDLLTEAESHDRRNVFDIPALGTRLAAARQWIGAQPELTGLPVGYFGASTGAAAALVAAAGDRSIRAVVSRGGRPDLATSALPHVTAPTLLIVGGMDDLVLGLNRQAMGAMRCDTSLEIVAGATHLFEEPGALEQVAELAGGWFSQHLR